MVNSCAPEQCVRNIVLQQTNDVVTAADKSTDIRIIIGSVVAGVIPFGGVSIAILYICIVQAKYVTVKIHLDI